MDKRNIVGIIGLFILLAPSVLAGCSDSDGGINYNVKGTCTDDIYGGTTDYCIDGSTLLEAECYSNTLCAIVAYTCPDSCSDGACVSSTNPTCTTGDFMCDNNDLFMCKCDNYICTETSWHVEEYCVTGESCNAEQGICEMTENAICTDSDDGKDEYTKGTAKQYINGELTQIATDYCYSNTQIDEYFCYNNQEIRDNVMVCSYQCQNGACISTTTTTIPDISGNVDMMYVGVVLTVSGMALLLLK